MARIVFLADLSLNFRGFGGLLGFETLSTEDSFSCFLESFSGGSLGAILLAGGGGLFDMVFGLLNFFHYPKEALQGLVERFCSAHFQPFQGKSKLRPSLFGRVEGVKDKGQWPMGTNIQR